MQAIPVSGAATSRQLLEELNAGYIRGVERGDGAWFQDHLAEEFSGSAADGSHLDKPAFIAQVAKPSGLSCLVAEQVRIHIIGDTAIIHGWTKYRKSTGENAAGRYTDIWMLRAGRWRCVAAHVTRD